MTPLYQWQKKLIRTQENRTEDMLKKNRGRSVPCERVWVESLDVGVC